MMSPVITIWFKEITDNIRDRRTLITALLMPVVLMPAILVGTFKLQEQQVKSAAKKIAKVAVVNAEQAPTLVNFLKSQDKVTLVPVPTNLQTALDNNTVNVVLVVPADFETRLHQQQPATVIVKQKSSNFDSSNAAVKIQTELQVFNQQQASRILTAAKVPLTALTSVIPQPQELASSEELGGYFLGLLLPMFLVLFAIIGGMYIAIDVSAGEKERKTLEALLVTPVSRLHIVAGKFLAVASTAVVTIILSMTSLYTAFKLIRPPDLGGNGATLVLHLTIPAALTMLGIGVILAVMFAGLLLSVAIFAKSYKEAQNYITPFYLLAVIPISIANTIPGFKPTIGYFLIPGMNAVLVMKEVLVGTYQTGHILATVGSLLVAAVLGILIASKIYSREDILFRD